MSCSDQGTTSTQSAPPGTPKPVRDPQLARQHQSTPVVRKHGPDATLTSSPKTVDKNRYNLGKEMDGRWLGAMPVEEFLDTYLPPAQHALPVLPDDPFGNVPQTGSEIERYNPFIAAIEEWMPRFRAINTGAKVDRVNNVKLKPDISIYERDESTDESTQDFSRMELWMEFKASRDGTPFRDPTGDEKKKRAAVESNSFTPETEKGIRARGQLTHYAGAMHGNQFRHFSYSVLVQGDYARFFRWEPSGIVVTAGFNYRKMPQLLAEFLWRFNHTTPKQRGHDVSVQPADLPPEDTPRVREKLGLEGNIPLFKYEMSGRLAGKGFAYGPRPTSKNYSIASRCTPTMPVIWFPIQDVHDDTNSCGENGSKRNTEEHAVEDKFWLGEQLVYMKDTWRFLSNLPDVKVKAEHEIYEILYQHETPNIPEHVTGGDVEGGEPQTQELVDAPWLCVKPKISLYQHYRLLQGSVGRPLFKFDCTKQLVQGVFDALRAHAHACEHARILHRDVSGGNIILTDEGKGLLIDWELAKMIDEEPMSRRPDRTGTWQFMSANLLMHPGRLHSVTDDLESFLHVLGWHALRFLPAIDSYTAHRRAQDLAMFDEYDHDGAEAEGGRQKFSALGAGWYPSYIFRPQTPTPLWALLADLGSPFKSLYNPRPPTAEDRKKIDDPTSETDEYVDLEELSHKIRTYDRDMSRLASSWFMQTMETYLGKKRWPTDDKSDEKLPIGASGLTERQGQNMLGTIQEMQSAWSQSKQVSKQVSTAGSKRSASPTTEQSAKRRRTPNASQTRD